MTDLKLIKGYREKAFTLEADELSKDVERFRKEAEDDTTGVKKYEFILLNLIIFNSIAWEFDIKETEDTYQRLVEEPWKDDEDDFPFEVKIEILLRL